jgi:hypothetical protein
VKRILLLLLLLACAAPALAQRGALTIPRNLDQLTNRSADILRGTVISARVEKHPELSGLNTVVVKLRVQETLKGQARDTFTFRQYIWDIRDRADAGGYRKGQDLLLLMIEPSRYGLSSPAGLEQGRFLISRDIAGRELALNGHGNLKLFDGVGSQMMAKGITPSPRSLSMMQKQSKGPVDLRDLTALIRELVQGSQ